MPAGGPGDHPVSDIVDYGRRVFSPEADELVREIAQLLSRDRLWELLDWWSPPPVDEFTAQLVQIRDRLRRDALDRGWEV